MSLDRMEPVNKDVEGPSPSKIPKNEEKHQVINSEATHSGSDGKINKKKKNKKNKVKEDLPNKDDQEVTKKHMSLKGKRPEDQAKSSGLPPPKTLPDQDEVASDTPGMNTSSSDFATLSQLPNYVDQTRVVARVQVGHSVTLVTAPKGWGKSTLISTLKYFYEIQVKPNGEKITQVDFPPNNLVNPNDNPMDNTFITDTPNYELFEETRLELEEPRVMKHLGKYPVIWLKFKGSVNNIEEALTNCRVAIREAYLQHWYLQNSTKLKKIGRQMISCYNEWSGMATFGNLGWARVVRSIRHLSEMLSIHWGRKCVILIDDYDAITMSSLKSESITLNEFDIIQKNLVAMLSYTLKDNSEYMERGFVTGRTYVLSLWSSVNNLDRGRFAGKHDYTKFYCSNGSNCDVWEDNEIPSNNKKLEQFFVW